MIIWLAIMNRSLHRAILYYSHAPFTLQHTQELTQDLCRSPALRGSSFISCPSLTRDEKHFAHILRALCSHEMRPMSEVCFAIDDSIASTPSNTAEYQRAQSPCQVTKSA